MTEETGCRSIGIDFLPGFIEAAEENRNNAAGRNRKNAVGRDRISFFQADAAAYEVPAEADRFFFFNPFSEVTLQAVLQNILDSWYIAPRRILLFFYYPSDAYIANLMNMDELEGVREVIIRFDEKELIIDNPSVSLMNVMGQETYQIDGKAREVELEYEIEIPDEDVEMVANSANVSEDEARAALEECKGDLAEAIMKLSQ